MKVKFSSLKNGEYFRHTKNGIVWQKIYNRFMIRVDQIGLGQSGWPIDIKTMVIPENRL